jgi:chorismate--pyruvate lyase
LNTPLQINLNHWHHYQRNPVIQIDPLWRAWLMDQGSLTQRLIDASRGDFRVRKLSQSWQRPTHSEAQCLGLPPRQLAMVREVELVCHGKPWVYARSVFPQSTLTGRLRCLKKLDSRPLGALLFSDPTMQRTHFEIAALSNAKLENYFTASGCHYAWGRRSLFFLDEKPILVAEVFLPALEQHARSN